MGYRELFLSIYISGLYERNYFMSMLISPYSVCCFIAGHTVIQNRRMPLSLQGHDRDFRKVPISFELRQHASVCISVFDRSAHVTPPVV